jgi:hypothetical protein
VQACFSWTLRSASVPRETPCPLFGSAILGGVLLCLTMLPAIAQLAKAKPQAKSQAKPPANSRGKAPFSL